MEYIFRHPIALFFCTFYWIATGEHKRDYIKAKKLYQERLKKMQDYAQAHHSSH